MYIEYLTCYVFRLGKRVLSCLEPLPTTPETAVVKQSGLWVRGDVWRRRTAGGSSSEEFSESKTGFT